MLLEWTTKDLVEEQVNITIQKIIKDPTFYFEHIKVMCMNTGNVVTDPLMKTRQSKQRINPCRMLSLVERLV